MFFIQSHYFCKFFVVFFHSDFFFNFGVFCMFLVFFHAIEQLFVLLFELNCFSTFWCVFVSFWCFLIESCCFLAIFKQTLIKIKRTDSIHQICTKTLKNTQASWFHNKTLQFVNLWTKMTQIGAKWFVLYTYIAKSLGK